MKKLKLLGKISLTQECKCHLPKAIQIHLSLEPHDKVSYLTTNNASLLYNSEADSEKLKKALQFLSKEIELRLE